MSLLADLRVWAVVALISVSGTATAMVPYYVGKRGIEAVLARFPRLEPHGLERVLAAYRKHGSGLLFLSFVPMLGVLLEAGAGIAGMGVAAFAVWVLLGRAFRNSILLVLVAQGLYVFGVH